MPQDAFTLRFLCVELNQTFLKGKINRITQPSEDEMVFTVYNGKSTDKLILDVNPGSPRIGVIFKEKESPLTPPNFCMLLRKHLLSAEIKSIEVVGYDRIVKIVFEKMSEFSDGDEKTLYVELMGRYSNVILTEDGKVLGSNRGINMLYNGVRPLIVGKPYVFPPVQDKKIPSDNELISYFEEYTGDICLAQYLCNGVQGIALSTAEEICREYNERHGEFLPVNAKEFFVLLNEFLYGKEYHPCVLFQDEKVKDVYAFPYANVSGKLVYFDKLFLAEEYYYREKKTVKEFNDKRSRLLSKLNTAIKKHKKKLSSFLSKEKEAVGYEENRIKGELILSNIYKIKQGETLVVLENYYDGNRPVEITLDERLSPSKNAEAYYKKYTKQKRTAEALIPQKEQVEKEIEYLNSVVEEVNSSENIEDLKCVANEMKEYGLIPVENIKAKKKEDASFRIYELNGYIIKVGRNNLENDRLLREAKPKDIWLHAKNYHSSHVIIDASKKVTEEIIILGAEICAYYSKGREGGKVEISYTERKNVKKPSKAKPGFVTYDNFKTITVEANKHTENIKTT